MKATGRAPGLNREFTAQAWRPFEKAFYEARMEAREAVHPSTAEIFASDIDNDVLNMARYHAQRAGVADAIQFSRKDARDFLPNMPGTLISNPPYAMRMGEKEEVHALYRAMGEQARKNQGMRWYFICADQEFERFFGKKADKKRKLYNGNVRCEFYQYFRKEKEI